MATSPSSFPHTRSWTLTSSSSTTSKSPSLTSSVDNGGDEEEEQDVFADQTLRDSSDVYEADLIHRRGSQRPGQLRQNLPRTMTHRQPAMYIRGDKIIIFPSDGSSRTRSIDQHLNRLRHRHCHNSLSKSSTSSSSHAQSMIHDLEISRLNLSAGTSQAIRWMLRERRHRYHITKLVLRSCFIRHPDALLDLLDNNFHHHRRRKYQLSNLKQLELHKISGTINVECIDAITRLTKLQELTLHINAQQHQRQSLRLSTENGSSTIPTRSAPINRSTNQILLYLFRHLHRLHQLSVLRLNGCQLEEVAEEEEPGDSEESNSPSQTSCNNGSVPVTPAISPIQALVEYFQWLSKHQQQHLPEHQLRKSWCTNLKHLSLKYCHLRDRSVVEILLAIQHVSSLRTLDLVGNQCGQGTLDMVGRILSRSNNGNDIINLEEQHVQSSVEVSTKLFESELPTLSPQSTPPTTTRQYLSSSLTMIDLSHQIDDMSQCNFIAFCAALKSKGELQSLRLAGNELGDDQICVLAESIHHNQSLQYLDLSENNISNEGCQSLLTALKSNRALLGLNLKHNTDIILDLSQFITVLKSHNFHLQQLDHSIGSTTTRSSIDIRNPHQQQPLRHSTRRCKIIQERNELLYYLFLNRCGRRLLRLTTINDSLNVPLSIWPLVLKRSMRLSLQSTCWQGYSCSHHRYSNSCCSEKHDAGRFRMDAVYNFLRYGPIFHTSSNDSNGSSLTLLNDMRRSRQ